MNNEIDYLKEENAKLRRDLDEAEREIARLRKVCEGLNLEIDDLYKTAVQSLPREVK